jgi:type IV secretory pathway VirB10-like protein
LRSGLGGITGSGNVEEAAVYPGPRPRRHSASFLALCTALTALLFLLAACGGNDDDTNDIATEPEPTPTQTTVAERDDDPAPTPEPEATEAAEEEATDDAADDPQPTPTEAPGEPHEEPTVEPSDEADLAPELVGLTDWRNTEPVTLEDLRGEPVVLVFWNSI